MKRSLLALLGILFAGAALVLRAEETVTVGGALVTLADGWKQTAKDNTVILTPADLPAGVSCAFTLLGGEPYTGSMKDQFAAEWKPLEALGTMVSDNDATLQGADGPLEIMARSGRIDNAGKQSAFVLMILARANGRIERMIFVTNSAESFQKYGAAVGGMLGRIQYVVPKPLPPLSGVCIGQVQVKTSSRTECWIFLPGGVVYRGFPSGGPANLDLEFQRKHRVGDIGEYRIDGEEVVATMKGEKTPTRFARANGAWAAKVTRLFQDRSSGIHGNTVATWTDEVSTTLRITRADPCDGLKLSGTYRLNAPTAKPPSSTLKFTADGEFTENGLVRVVDPGTTREGGGKVPSSIPVDGGRGKYTIGKNTLTLTYADGSKLSLLFYLADGDEVAKPTPSAVYVQESKLVAVP